MRNYRLGLIVLPLIAACSTEAATKAVIFLPRSVTQALNSGLVENIRGELRILENTGNTDDRTVSTVVSVPQDNDTVHLEFSFADVPTGTYEFNTRMYGDSEDEEGILLGTFVDPAVTLVPGKQNNIDRDVDPNPSAGWDLDPDMDSDGVGNLLEIMAGTPVTKPWRQIGGISDATSLAVIALERAIVVDSVGPTWLGRAAPSVCPLSPDQCDEMATPIPPSSIDALACSAISSATTTKASGAIPYRLVFGGNGCFAFEKWPNGCVSWEWCDQPPEFVSIDLPELTGKQILNVVASLGESNIYGGQILALTNDGMASLHVAGAMREQFGPTVVGISQGFHGETVPFSTIGVESNGNMFFAAARDGAASGSVHKSCDLQSPFESDVTVLLTDVNVAGNDEEGELLTVFERNGLRFVGDVLVDLGQSLEFLDPGDLDCSLISATLVKSVEIPQGLGDPLTLGLEGRLLDPLGTVAYIWSDSYGDRYIDTEVMAAPPGGNARIQWFRWPRFVAGPGSSGVTVDGRFAITDQGVFISP